MICNFSIKSRFKYDTRTFYFGNRVVDHWNSLPKWVVTANNIKLFLKRLDQYWHHHHHHHHHNCCMALFPGPPGWAGARRELLDFMVQGRINRGRHTDHSAGRHSIWTNQCPPHHPPRQHQNIIYDLWVQIQGIGSRSKVSWVLQYIL